MKIQLYIQIENIIYIKTAINCRAKIPELSGNPKSNYDKVTRTEGYAKYSQGQRIEGEKI